GLQPDGPPAPGAWLGNVPVTMPEGSPPSEFLLRADVIPGELYWVESSTDLADWELFPGSLFVPADFTRVPVSWDIPAAPDLRRFWRIGGGWPAGRGSDPLAGGLAGLHFVGGNS